jgi:cytochrome c oxidase cbb3-type subunit 3
MEKNNKEVKYDGKPFEHEFDGIQELNNAVPPWLLYFWYITVTFSVIYVAYYHFLGNNVLQDAEYQKDMVVANKNVADQKASSGEMAMLVLNDDANLAAGAEIYKTKLCVTCHGNLGEGNAIGPNLTDKFWINGKGLITDVFEVIKNGVAAKGMMPYKDQLSEQQILQVSSYVLAKLQGSNPPNAKPPQGEMVE